MSAAKPLSIALFGLGRIGVIHAKNVLRCDETVLTVVVDPDLERARSWCDQHSPSTVVLPSPADHAVASYQKIIEDHGVDAVIICSTTNTHEAIIRSGIASRRPMFSEKPIAETVDATLDVCDSAEKAGVPLFCGFNRRSDRQFRETYDRRPEIGRMMTIRSTSRDHPSVCPVSYMLTSGGQLVDQTVHDIDMCMWMAGEFPSSVYAVGHAFDEDIREMGDTDTVVVTLQFPSGVMATIDNTRRAVYGYDTRLEILGNKGMLTLENVRPSSVVVHGAEGTVSKPIHTHFLTRFDDAYLGELTHFVDFLRGRVDQLRITPREAAAAVKVSAAATVSLKTKAPVTLTW